MTSQKLLYLVDVWCFPCLVNFENSALEESLDLSISMMSMYLIFCIFHVEFLGFHALGSRTQCHFDSRTPFDTKSHRLTKHGNHHISCVQFWYVLRCNMYMLDICELLKTWFLCIVLFGWMLFRKCTISHLWQLSRAIFTFSVGC